VDESLPAVDESLLAVDESLLAANGTLTYKNRSPGGPGRFRGYRFGG
jgi:hypothetical protein